MRGSDQRELSAEQKRVLERYHTSFRRAGAALDGAAKQRLAEMVERLAELGTTFSQNVLADEQTFALSLYDEAELAGLPDFMREAMASDARERGLDGYAVTLSRSSAEPLLDFAQRRDLREKVYRAFVSRGDATTPSSPASLVNSARRSTWSSRSITTPVSRSDV